MGDPPYLLLLSSYPPLRWLVKLVRLPRHTIAQQRQESSGDDDHGSVTPSHGHPNAAGQVGRPDLRLAAFPPGLPGHQGVQRRRRQDHVLPAVRRQGRRRQVHRRRQARRLRARHLGAPRLGRERGGHAQEADLRRDPEQDVHGGKGHGHGEPVPDHRRRRRLLPVQGRQVPDEEVLPGAYLLHRQGRGHRQERAARVPEDQAHDPPHLHPRRDRGSPRRRLRRHPQVRGEGRHRLRRRHRAASRRRARAVPLHRQAARRHRQARELRRALPRAQLPWLLLPRPQGPWWLHRLRQRRRAPRRRQGRRGGAREGEHQERCVVHGQHHIERHQEQPGNWRGHRCVRECAAVGHRPWGQGTQGCENPGGLVRATRVELDVRL